MSYLKSASRALRRIHVNLGSKPAQPPKGKSAAEPAGQQRRAVLMEESDQSIQEAPHHGAPGVRSPHRRSQGRPLISTPDQTSGKFWSFMVDRSGLTSVPCSFLCANGCPETVQEASDQMMQRAGRNRSGRSASCV